MKVTGLAPWRSDWPRGAYEDDTTVKPIVFARIRGRVGTIHSFRGTEDDTYYMFLPDAPLLTVMDLCTNPGEDLMAFVSRPSRVYVSTTPHTWKPNSLWDMGEFELSRNDVPTALERIPRGARLRICTRLPLVTEDLMKELRVVQIQFIPISHTTLAVLGYDDLWIRFWLFDLAGGRQLAHVRFPRRDVSAAVPLSFSYAVERDPETRPSIQRILNFFVVTIYFSDGSIAELTPLWPGHVWCRLPESVYMAVDYLKSMLHGIFGGMPHERLNEFEDTLKVTWDARIIEEGDADDEQGEPSESESDTERKEEEGEVQLPPLQPSRANSGASSNQVSGEVNRPSSNLLPEITPRVFEAAATLGSNPFEALPGIGAPIAPPPPQIAVPEVAFDRPHGVPQGMIPDRNRNYSRGESGGVGNDNMPAAPVEEPASQPLRSPERVPIGRRFYRIKRRGSMSKSRQTTHEREMTLALYTMWKITSTLEMIPTQYSCRHRAFLGRPSSDAHFEYEVTIPIGTQIAAAPKLVGYANIGDGLIFGVQQPHQLVLLARNRPIGQVCEIFRSSTFADDERWRVVGPTPLPNIPQGIETEQSPPRVMIKRASSEEPVVVLGYGKYVFRITCSFLGDGESLTEIALATELPKPVRDIQCTKDGKYVRVLMGEAMSTLVSTTVAHDTRPEHAEEPDEKKQRDIWTVVSLEWIGDVLASMPDTGHFERSPYMADFLHTLMKYNDSLLYPIYLAARCFAREGRRNLVHMRALISEKLAVVNNRADELLKRKNEMIERVTAVAERSRDMKSRVSALRENTIIYYNMKMQDNLERLLSPVEGYHIMGIQLNGVDRALMKWIHQSTDFEFLYKRALQPVRQWLEEAGRDVTDWSSGHLLHTINVGSWALGRSDRFDIQNATMAELATYRLYRIEELIKLFEDAHHLGQNRERRLGTILKDRRDA